MKITTDMLHPELRQVGKWIRRLQPKMNQRKMKKLGRFSQKALYGKYSGPNRLREVWIPRKDGSLLRLCVFRPRERMQSNKEIFLNQSGKQWDASVDKSPGLLWFHGGGFSLGSPEQDERLIDDFIEVSGTVVVAPDYTLSGDAPYPAALEDAYLALKWLKEHAPEYGVRLDQLFIGGNSAGGGLAAALSLLARDRGEVNIAFQIPLYPMLDASRQTASAQIENSPVWNSQYNEVAWKMYLGPDYQAENLPIYASPAQATDFSNLPPTYTHVGTMEPFFDETVSYISHLLEAGVPVHFKLFEGAYHAFDIIQPNTPIAKEARAHLLATFKYAVDNYFSKQPN